ncbi:hypothetical protein ACVIW2_000208 [Bradyrhizobium huanghuaihaiense]|uniref:ParB/Sulfiredoxin domain-containing protein n=1 Tax=Bradyrhizobium barranii subsp. barranii TaxID=2823807 RepID=A0A7Z0QLI6_9BRAD|nr:hypothetical protein [Bradyrhizobium barranii]UGX89674.1 hypothetical protein G6321_00000835 [Bradyrhizobium barranii subsp. barranii]
MKLLIDKRGNTVASLDDENRIIQGHHRIYTMRKLGLQLFIKDGDRIARATFLDDDSVSPTVH